MTQSNQKIAITGGIGSGKSTVAKIIAEQGHRVLSCDEIYKSLLTESEFVSRLCEEFGDILDKNSRLDRQKLSAIVFADAGKLKMLNDLTHPEIMRRALKQMSGEGINFCEVPLLFESGYERFFDKVIVVLREKRERVKSVVQRDNITESAVLSRIANQFDYENADLKKFYVINNTSDFCDLRSKTLNILRIIENLK